jgi:hypothetical protein
MTPSLDALRTKYPHLSFTVYAYTGKPVTLECITAEGKIFAFAGPTETEAILAGFGDDFTQPAPAPETPTTSVFD